MRESDRENVSARESRRRGKSESELETETYTFIEYITLHIHTYIKSLTTNFLLLNQMRMFMHIQIYIFIHIYVCVYFTQITYSCIYLMIYTYMQKTWLPQNRLPTSMWKYVLFYKRSNLSLIKTMPTGRQRHMWKSYFEFTSGISKNNTRLHK